MPDPLPTATVLLGTTATLAIVHTLLGVDHSLPFVALGRARGWSLRRTLLVTATCGGGHVLSSVAIGAVGVGLGVATDALLWLEAARGEAAAALLFGFGLAYALWALWRRRRATAGPHADGAATAARVTPWALFLVFVLGPCEPLIPLMVAPAVTGDWLTLGAVVALFGLLTIAVMLATVTAGHRGIELLGARRLGRHADLAAGLVVAASGAAVLWLGL